MRSRPLVVAAAVTALLAVPLPAHAAQASLRPGQLVVVAGLGPAGYSGDGGPARDARISAGPISVGGDGAVYLSDADHVRRVTPDGVIDTVLTAQPGEQLRTAEPGPDGALYLTVDANEGRQLRRIDGSGEATVLATAPGGLGSPSFDDLAVDAAGNAYVYDEAGKRVVRVDPSGQVTPVGDAPIEAPGVRLAVGPDGTVYVTTRTEREGGQLYALAATGPPVKLAELAERPPSGPAVAPDGTVYFIDTGRTQIMRIGADGKAVAVSPALHGMGEHLAIGPDGDLYFSYYESLTEVHRVLRLVQHGEPGATEPAKPSRSPWADDAPGTVHPVAGTGRNPSPSPKDQGHQPVGSIAVGADGTVYVAEPTRHQVRAIAPDGTIKRFAGNGKPGEPADYKDKPADQVVLRQPTSVAPAPDGTVYVLASGNVYRVTPAGRISTFDLDSGAAQVAVDAAGTLYFATRDAIRKLGADGESTLVVGYDLSAADEDALPLAHKQLLNGVRALAIGADGSVYFMQDAGNTVEVVRPDGTLTTVTGGQGAGFAGDGGPAAGGAINHAGALAIGSDGACYVADTYNNRIRRINGDIGTVAGSGPRGDTGDGGPATSATLTDPTGVALGPDGTVYALTGTDLVRAIGPDGVIRTVADLTPTKAVRATEVSFGPVDGFAVGPDGTLYVASAAGLHTAQPGGDLLPFEMDPPLVTYAEHGTSVPAEPAPLATGPDGSLYLAPNAALRIHPDGGVVTLLGGGQNNRMPDQAPEDWASPTDYTFREGDPRDIAVGRDGTLYLSTQHGVYARTPDGELTTVLKAGEHDLFGGIALDPDGELYVITNLSQVRKVVNGKSAPVVGPAYGDEKPKYDRTLEDPSDIAFTSDGTMFVSVGAEIRRFSPNGDTAVVHRADKGTVTQLAVGPGDDLYFLTPDDRRIRVLVRPVDAPESATSENMAVSAGWLVLGVLVVGVGAGIVVQTRRKVRRNRVHAEE